MSPAPGGCGASSLSARWWGAILVQGVSGESCLRVSVRFCFFLFVFVFEGLGKKVAVEMKLKQLALLFNFSHNMKRKKERVTKDGGEKDVNRGTTRVKQHTRTEIDGSAHRAVEWESPVTQSSKTTVVAPWKTNQKQNKKKKMKEKSPPPLLPQSVALGVGACHHRFIALHYDAPSCPAHSTASVINSD